MGLYTHIGIYGYFIYTPLYIGITYMYLYIGIIYIHTHIPTDTQTHIYRPPKMAVD